MATTSPRHKAYRDRGVTVCERWHSLPNFIADLPTLPNYELWKNDPKEYTLDKDMLLRGNKLYAPEYCSFQNKKTQAKHTGRNNSLGLYWDETDKAWTVVTPKEIIHGLPSIKEAAELLETEVKTEVGLSLKCTGITIATETDL